MRKMRHADSMTQLCLKDASDARQSFLYRLSSKPCFALFRNVLLVSSPQDHYVPRHSARVEICSEALGDQILGASRTRPQLAHALLLVFDCLCHADAPRALYHSGSVYVEMMCNLLGPVLTSHASSSSAAATKSQTQTASPAAVSTSSPAAQTGTGTGGGSGSGTGTGTATLVPGRFTGSLRRKRDEAPDETPPSRNQVLVRYDVVFDLPHDTSAFIGRAAHCATMENELFLHKLMLVTLSKYFV